MPTLSGGVFVVVRCSPGDISPVAWELTAKGVFLQPPVQALRDFSRWNNDKEGEQTKARKSEGEKKVRKKS